MSKITLIYNVRLLDESMDTPGALLVMDAKIRSVFQGYYTNSETLEKMARAVLTEDGLEEKCPIELFNAVLSPFEGYVEEINVSAARVLAKELNAIRYSKEEYVDLGSGLEFCKKIGDRVNKGDILGVVYTNNTDKVAHAVEAFLDMYKLSNKKVKVSSRVREVF